MFCYQPCYDFKNMVKRHW